MFDPQEMVPYTSISPDVIDCNEHRELARQVALESIVLLKNENGFLPLSKDIGSIAVIGPNADVCQFGNYSGIPSYAVTPLEGIKNAVSNATRVEFAKGAPLRDNNLPPIPSKCLLPPDAREGEHGLKGEYFNNMHFEGEPVLTRIDSNLDQRWWNEELFPDSVVNTDHFSVRWTGKIVPEKSERYMISARTTVMSSGDDLGIRIYLDGVKILDQWRDHRIWETAITKELTAGKPYDIRVEYVEDIDWASVLIGWKPCGKNLVTEAVEIAKNAELVILVAGSNNSTEGEHLDRTTLDLLPEQQELIRKVYEANPNTVLTLVNGSPVSIVWEKEYIPAIVEAWYPGQEGGTAIAEVLFGDYNPGGKLPLTFYTGLEQLPAFDDYDVTKGRTYMYLEEKPLFPFGFGLSYTRFNVSNENIEKKNLSDDDSLKVSFDLENVGDRKGSEVVQLYIREPKASKYSPNKALKAFKRIELDAKEKRRVTLSVPVKELATYSLTEKEFVTNKGTYTMMVGNSSEHFFFRDEIVIND
jgi:beta-glucosidase